MSVDRIEKKVVLKASRSRVWDAISDAAQFGQWFGVEIDGPFVVGQESTGRIAPTKVDPEVARLQEPYCGIIWRVVVERMEPQRSFAFRWHPYAIDRDYDYASEPMTLVTFDLADVEDGVLLTITESGFDAVPLARRAAALEANEGGWAHQTRLLTKYLEQNNKG